MAAATKTERTTYARPTDQFEVVAVLRDLGGPDGSRFSRLRILLKAMGRQFGYSCRSIAAVSKYPEQTAAELVESLRRRGFRITASQDELVVIPLGELTAADRAAFRCPATTSRKCLRRQAGAEDHRSNGARRILR